MKKLLFTMSLLVSLAMTSPAFARYCDGDCEVPPPPPPPPPPPVASTPPEVTIPPNQITPVTVAVVSNFVLPPAIPTNLNNLAPAAGGAPCKGSANKTIDLKKKNAALKAINCIVAASGTGAVNIIQGGS